MFTNVMYIIFNENGENGDVCFAVYDPDELERAMKSYAKQAYPDAVLDFKFGNNVSILKVDNIERYYANVIPLWDDILERTKSRS